MKRIGNGACGAYSSSRGQVGQTNGNRTLKKFTMERETYVSKIVMQKHACYIVITLMIVHQKYH